MKARKIFLSLGSLAALASCGIIAGTTTSCSGKNITPEDEEKLMLAVIRQDTQLWFSSNLEYPSETPADVWYKIKKETEWNKLEDKQTVNFTAGQTVYFKGNNPDGFSKSQTGSILHLTRNPQLQFTNGSVFLNGNVMALLNNGSGQNLDAIPNDSCFYSLLDSSTGITSVANNFLPATNLTANCYTSMFENCTSLTTAPELPATTLADLCYFEMFKNCSNMTTAPELPATNLAYSCYSNMFASCTSLTNAPALPATNLADSCYYGMFQNCTSLTNAPALPATALVDSCYSSMFSGCTSLTKSPQLPATTLATFCYSNMFDGCTSLTKAPQLPAKSLENAESCYQYMFSGCKKIAVGPELPATTLAPYCYTHMFDNCANMTVGPELPATTLANRCYEAMFKGCTSLIKAPQLPATTLAYRCYEAMFKGCTHLNNIKIHYTGNFTIEFTSSWVEGVAANGTFYYNGNDTTRGISAIPGNDQTWPIKTF